MGHLQPWQQAAVLTALVLAVFSPVLSAGFVYDARLQILTDTFLHDPGNWWPVLTFSTLGMDVLDFNRPVNLASLMLDATLWGRESFGYHLTSVLLHAVNVVMVAAVGRALRGATPGGTGQAQSEGLSSLLGAAIFAVHPLVAEAVCEPTFREDLLVACFTLSGLLLAMGQPTCGHGGWRAVGCIACALLAIGSKESGIAAPAAVGIYWLLFRRSESGRFWPAAVGGTTLVVIAFLIARFLLEPRPSKIFEAQPQHPGGSLAAALLIEPRILALYVQLILLPANLSADYGLYSVSHLPLPVALVVLAAVAGIGILAIRADRRMAVAAALVVAPLLPVANLIPIYQAAADRYLYLPMAGVGLAGGLLLEAPWLATRERLRERLLVGTALATILLAVGCMEREKVWTNQLALWTDTHRKNPLSSTAASGLAEALREEDRFAEAEPVARRAIRLSDAKGGDAWATLALILDGQGRSAEAFDALDRAVEVDAKLADPDARVAALAMERSYADDLKRLQARRREKH